MLKVMASKERGLYSGLSEFLITTALWEFTLHFPSRSLLVSPKGQLAMLG